MAGATRLQNSSIFVILFNVIGMSSSTGLIPEVQLDVKGVVVDVGHEVLHRGEGGEDDDRD